MYNADQFLECTKSASLYAQPAPCKNPEALDLGRRGICDLWHGANVAHPFGFDLADRAEKGRPEATATVLDLPCKVGEVAHEEVGHLILGHAACTDALSRQPLT